MLLCCWVVHLFTFFSNECYRVGCFVNVTRYGGDIYCLVGWDPFLCQKLDNFVENLSCLPFIWKTVGGILHKKQYSLNG